MSMDRKDSPDPAFVRDFLDTVAHVQKAGDDPGFDRHVVLRLQGGASEYRGAYREKGEAWVMREVREECADVAAWLILATELLFEAEGEGAVEPEDAHLARMKFVNWASVARYLWREVSTYIDEDW